MTRNPPNLKRIRSIVDHVLIGAIIVLGTSFVTLASQAPSGRPDATLYEKVMHLVPGCRP